MQEFLSGGSLQQYLKTRKTLQKLGQGGTWTIDSERENRQTVARTGWSLSEIEAKVIFKQILFGVHFMHQRNVVHRDIKLENLLFDETGWRVKIVDLGFATCLASER